MSKSVRVDDDIHASMKKVSDRFGIDISKLITIAWENLERKKLPLIKTDDFEIKVTGDVTVLPKVTC